MDFSSFFRTTTEFDPLPYQKQLASSDPLLLNIPTGLGKTAAVVLAWWWKRYQAPDETPRLLAYCLPARTLVTQTYKAVCRWCDRLPEEIGFNKERVYLLMGGEIDRHWRNDPDCDRIVIGTQDQLISRALNRGYSMSRYTWPVDFALLNNDCYWVFDEIQLMGVALPTSAQLQGLRDKLGTVLPTRSLWMSATLDKTKLETVDFPISELSNACLQLNSKDLATKIVRKRVGSQKPLHRTEFAFTDKDNDLERLAEEILLQHRDNTLTLVVLNRVAEARETYRALQKRVRERGDRSGGTSQLELPLFDSGSIRVKLIHSRFRPGDREWETDYLAGDPRGILVATQAIEAGVDIDATTLFSQLAPWSSLVQRFGRCNRRGNNNKSARAFWIDDLTKKPLPYTVEALDKARSQLERLTDVSPQNLKEIVVPEEVVISPIPRQRDLLQLFDTTPDLNGRHIDISCYVRDRDDRDLGLVWRNFEGEPPVDFPQFDRREICRVSVWQAREFLKKKDRSAWIWNDLTRQWIEPKSIYPGQTLLLSCQTGGYSSELGWTGNPDDRPKPFAVRLPSNHYYEGDSRSLQRQCVTLTQHSLDVKRAATNICQSLKLPEDISQAIVRAAWWHDAGKAHEYFQQLLRSGIENERELEGELLAKSSGAFHAIPSEKQRRGFRHELASALAALNCGEDFLVCYLIACHHGKVRMSISPSPLESGTARICGIEEGDKLPDISLGDGLEISGQVLSLEYASLGSPSWLRQAAKLLKHWGPFQLAYLEAIVRLADWRASENPN